MINKAAQEMARLSWAHGTSEARREAARRNGAMPCHPGKRRGRPKKRKAKRPNIPFIHECFQEAVEGTLAEAKAEIDTAVLHAQVTLGKEACERLAAAGKGALQIGDGKEASS